MNKVILDKIKHIRANKKIKLGLAHGVFDVLHVGHIKYFEEAKKKVGFLVVSVTDDKYVNKAPGKPIFKIDQRIEMLKSVKFIDLVVKSSHETSIPIIREIKPNIYFKGKDYLENFDITKNILKEEKEVRKYGGSILYTSSETFSSSKLINNEFDYLNPEAKKLFKKNNFSKIKNKFYNQFSKKIKKKILIIGDPILDIYNYVNPSGKSNKANIISTQFKTKKIYAGGSILVSNLLSEFCENVTYLALSNKSNNDYFKKFLKKDVKINTFKSDTKIIQKKRFIDEYSNLKLFQVTENENNNISEIEEMNMLNFLKKNYKNYDKIFIFDFGYYTLTKKLIKLTNKISFHKKIINCQSNSYNYGFNIFLKHTNSDVMCIDELEFRLAVNNKTSDIKKLIRDNIKVLNKYKIFIVTLGKKGCFIVQNKKISFIPTVLDKAVDTIGCGDVFITIFGILNLSSKFNILEKALISHIAAGIHAYTLGNEMKINFMKLYKSIDNILK